MLSTREKLVKVCEALGDISHSILYNTMIHNGALILKRICAHILDIFTDFIPKSSNYLMDGINMKGGRNTEEMTENRLNRYFIIRLIYNHEKT